MEPLLILILIPLLAALILRADSLHTRGLDPETRNAARQQLPVLAIIVWGLSGLFFVLAFREFGHTIRETLLVTLRCTVGGGLLYLGWKTWQLSGHVEQDDLELREIVRRDVEASAARTTALAFVLLPLLLPSLIAVATLGFIPIIFLVLNSHPRRIMQNQLLWTLALATKNQLDPALEVQGLANSLSQKQFSGWKIVFWVVLTMLGLGVLALLAVMIRVLMFFAMIVVALIVTMTVFRKRKQRRLVAQLQTLASALHDGIPLAQALNQTSGLLPTEVIGAIEAATEAGDVGTVLSGIAMNHSRGLERRQLLGGLGSNALLYILMIITVLLQVVAFIMFWIIPKYKSLFQEFDVELPWLTQLWIKGSEFCLDYWYLAGPMVFLPLLPFVLGLLMMIDETVWIPAFLKRAFPRIETPDLLKRLGYVASQNRQLSPSLMSLANSTTDFARARRFERLENRLSQGDSLGTALGDERFINAREASSIDNAAQTGHLGWALNAIADAMRQRRVDRARWFMEFMRPLVVIALAAFVASFCAAMFLPLVDLIGKLAV